MDAGSIVPPQSRNSPCPCGSGQRYKNCHGLLAESGGAAAVPSHALQRSTYRAPAAEWLDVGEDEQDHLGGMMERALAHQLAARTGEAERDYRAVLERAPDTHDALHMLGVIELGRQNLDEAELLIRRAMTLRAPHPAIVRNLKLVEEAKLTHRRENPERLCERALPILSDLLRGGSPGPAARAVVGSANAPGDAEIHLVGRLHAPLCDDGWLLQRLGQLIDARIWSLDARGTGSFANRKWFGIDADTGSFPRFGTHVIVGVDTENFDWLDRATPDRVIVFCSGVTPSICLDQLRRIARDGARTVELAFFSSAEAARFGAGHHVIVPPVALPPPPPPAAAQAPPPRGVWRIEERARWRLGIVGQTHQAVQDVEAGEGLQRLRHYADELAIYDAGRLRFEFGDQRNVRFFARTPDGLLPFLSRLDALVVRPRTWYHESGIQEFFTARALGVPILCPVTSRWAEYMQDGIDGLLYENDDRLLELVSDLRTAPGWAADIGAAARKCTAALLDPERLGRAYAQLIHGPRIAASRHAARAKLS